MAQSEATARDQFVMGLKPGKVQRKLERLLRQSPTLSFRETYTEAQALEKEQGTKEQAQISRVVAPQYRGPNLEDLEKWKEGVKTELKQEIQDQISTISKTLIEEIRRQMSPVHTPSPNRGEGDSRRRQPREQSPYQPSPRSSRDFQWDRQGRPICNGCGFPEHTQRFCNAGAQARGNLN